MATDVTENTRNRLVPLLTGLGVPIVRCGTVVELGRAVGKERLAIVGIADVGFADQLMANLPVEESTRHGVITEEDGSWGT